MKQLLLTILMVLIILLSVILSYHVFSKDTQDKIQEEHKEVTLDEVMDEIDTGLLEEDDEITIGEMV